MPTSSQEKQFQSLLQDQIPRSILEDSLSWVRDNLSPDDVFTTSQLESWAEGEGYVKKEDQE